MRISTAWTVYAFTARGRELGRLLARTLGGSLHVPARLADRPGRPGPAGGCPSPPAQGFDSLSGDVAARFPRSRGLIFVGASGIAVRAVAPHLESKASDPAVISLDEDGRTVVPLVSGHAGGANELARRVAEITGGTAAVSTATDLRGLPAVELLAAEAGLTVATWPAVRHVAAALLEGRTVGVHDPELHFLNHLDAATAAHFPATDAEALRDAPCGVWVHWRELAEIPAGHLTLRPRVLVAGVGCRRGTPAGEIVDHIEHVLDAHKLARASLAGLATIQAKLAEPGLREAADRLGVPLTGYTAEALAGVEVPTPSERVAAHMGVASVCEAACLIQSRGPLLVPKTLPPSPARVTVAIAVCQPPSKQLRH